MNKYNVVLHPKQAEKFKEWLNATAIDYEPSSYGQGIYFNIRATEKQADAMNAIIEALYHAEGENMELLGF